MSTTEQLRCVISDLCDECKNLRAALAKAEQERDALAKCKLIDKDAYIVMRGQRDELQAKLTVLKGKEPINPYPEGSPGSAWQAGYNGTTNFGAKGSDNDRQWKEGAKARKLYAAAGAAPVPEGWQHQGSES